MRDRRRLLFFCLLLLACASLALWIRFALVERHAVALACDAGEASLACALRGGAIALFSRDIPGWVALGAGLLTLLRPRAWSLAVTLAAGSLGLFLYNTELAATGLTLALLALARRLPAPAA